MGNIRNKFAQFMYGRYGTDQMQRALLVLYIVLFVVSIFVNSSIITIIMWAILVWMIFRTFSRNIPRRAMENDKYLKIRNVIKSKLSLLLRRVKEIKTHRYRKCPHCKSVLRLPRKTGKRTVRCPRCHKEFETKIIL